ncbi:AraC family transcriptional regulator [Christensenella tenuis]|uniref:Helix-turn-helix transcriptional regulator n=1 Tax=Christensenella tenuis TaxID=2763033 RepID=A0ABR7EGL6_9FIRM|nr:helix-turn-helix transcriptional regulator [Christensenella tenuis]
MDSIRWLDSYFDDGERIVLTQNELKVPGLRTMGKNTSIKATSGLSLHYHENSFEFALVTKGNVTFSVDGKNYKLSGGDVFMCYPDEPHDTASAPMTIHEMIWFQLDVSQLKDFLFLNKQCTKGIMSGISNIKSRVIKTEQRDINLLRSSFSLFYKFQKSQNTVYLYEATSSLVVFIFRLIERSCLIQFKLTPDIGRTVEYILNNIYEVLDLDDLAAIAGLSLSHFKQKFKYQMGDTPREFVNRKKIDEAKELLLHGKSVTEAAMSLNFSSSNYFSAVFKRFTSYTPTEFVKISAEVR